jgi:hypothetical protein
MRKGGHGRKGERGLSSVGGRTVSGQQSPQKIYKEIRQLRKTFHFQRFTLTKHEIKLKNKGTVSN